MKRISLPKVIIAFTILCTVLFIGAQTLHTDDNAVSVSAKETKITYVSVPITASDTLSSIAEQYYSQEFGSRQDYIKKIRQYNSLKSDAIYAGNHLIVPICNTVHTETASLGE